MRVITTEKVFLCNDREGKVIEHVQIDFKLVSKDDVNKTYTFEAVDSIVYDKGLETESVAILRNRHGDIQVKQYVKTYQEYDEQKAVLESIYGEETDLTGSEREDFLMLKALLYNLVSDNVYEGVWEAR